MKQNIKAIKKKKSYKNWKGKNKTINIFGGKSESYILFFSLYERFFKFYSAL